MRSSACLFASCLSLVPLAACTSAQTPPKAPAQTTTKADSAAALTYKDEPVVVEHYDDIYRFHADGTGTHTLHVVVRLQSEGAVRQWGVLAFAYASAVESSAIDQVRVHKPDGSTVDTPVTDAVDMSAPVTREAPLFSDLKEQQIPVRNLAVGDTLEYTTHTTRTTPEAPNQFWGSDHFTATGLVVLSQTLTLEVPASTYVQVWNPHHPATPTTHDTLRTWTWTSSQLQPSGRDKDGNPTGAASAKDPDTDADGRVLPSVAWTTFHSWAEVGAWYRSLALSRAQPTPDISKQAAELTTGLTTPEAQTQALYTFVSTTIRYVGVDLGIGRYQPHTASDVLAARYGDCKDKDTLLEALLRARGVPSAPALIGFNLAPVSELPSPALFNHVITTVKLPSGTIWLDSTPEVNPFRLLSLPLRDQQALVVPPTGDAHLERTPAAPPFPFFETFNATATLDASGLLKGHIVYTIRSDNEPGVRLMVQRVAPSQWDEAVQYLSTAMGFSGKVTNVDLHQTDPTAPVHLAYDYTRPDYSDWANERILPLFPVLEIAQIDKENAPEHDIDQGEPRTVSSTTQITLPQGFRPDPPEAIHSKRPYASFDQTYTFSNDVLTIQRTVKVLQRKVPKAEWKDYLAYLKETGVQTGENFITLLPPEKDEKDTAKAAPPKRSATTTSATSAEDLVTQAGAAERVGNWTSARSLLDQAQKLDPHARYVQSMLGFLSLRNRQTDEAILLLKSELHDHPDDDLSIVRLLVGALLQQKRSSEAIDFLQAWPNHDTPEFALLLAGSQSVAGRNDDAVSTLQKASTAHPDNRNLESALADSLLQSHHDVEAAAAAKAAMDGSDDPTILNGNSYVLAELNMDLPLAEENARHAITLLEASSAKRDLASANSAAFRETGQIAATWDTLGYILLREGKLQEAAPLLAAAWFNETNTAVGNHLGQLYEAQGRMTDALALYRVALGAEKSTASRGDTDAVNASITRLQAAGVHPSTGEAARSPQDLRTFHMQRPINLKGWGTLRLELSNSGITNSALVTGPSDFNSVRSSLVTIKLPGAVPPTSSAHLLRDAVVSCSSGQPTCELVFMPHSNLEVEAIQ